MAFIKTYTWSRDVNVNTVKRGELTLTFTLEFTDCDTLASWGVNAVPSWSPTYAVVAVKFAPKTPITLDFEIAKDSFVRGTLKCAQLPSKQWGVRTDRLDFGFHNTAPESFLGELFQLSAC